MLGYLTQESVLKALGVPVNFTEAAPVVHKQFDKTYEYAFRTPFSATQTNITQHHPRRIPRLDSPPPRQRRQGTHDVRRPRLRL